MHWLVKVSIVVLSTLICYGFINCLFIKLGIIELWDFIGRIAVASWVTLALLNTAEGKS